MSYTQPRQCNETGGILATDEAGKICYFGPDESDEERQAVYAALAAGEYGPVAAYVDPSLPVVITPDQVDAERDRRIAGTFMFGGVAYQLDRASQQNIIAKGAQAKFAVLNGAVTSDLRWANPDADFGWIATDNAITPMDAQTTAAMADAADLWVTSHIMAGRALKNLDPIPLDYAAEGYWPASGQ